MLRFGARTLGLWPGGPGVWETAGGSPPGEEGFRGVGAVLGAGRSSAPVPFCFLVVAGGTGALGVTITGSGTTGGAELPAGWAKGGWTGRNDWLGGWLLAGRLLAVWLLGGWLLGEGWTGRNDW